MSQALEQILEDDEDKRIVLLLSDQNSCRTDADENEGESEPCDVAGNMKVQAEDPAEERPPSSLLKRLKKTPVNLTKNSEEIEGI